MLHRLCFSFRCRSYSKMGSRTVPCFNAKVLSTGGQRPPTTFAASRQRRDLIIAHTMGWGFPKGRGRNPSPFGRFKGIGFLRKGGNLPPSPASGGANSNRGQRPHRFYRAGRGHDRRPHGHPAACCADCRTPNRKAGYQQRASGGRHHPPQSNPCRPEREQGSVPRKRPRRRAPPSCGGDAGD